MKYRKALMYFLAVVGLLLAACGQAASPVPATLPSPTANAAATDTAMTANTPVPTAPPPATATTTPVPTAPAAATGMTTPNPGALVGRYFFAGDPTTTLDLMPDGWAYWPSDIGTYTVSGNQITFVNPWQCDTQPGVYQWSLEQDVLKLTAVDDPCTARSGPIKFTKMTKQPPQPYTEYVWRTPVDDYMPFLAVDQQGNAYVTNYNANTFSKYGPDGKQIATWGDGKGQGDGQFLTIGGIAVDGQGNIYVGDQQGARIEKFDASGEFLTSWKLNTPPGPAGLGVDAQGNVYVALRQPQDHYVEKYSADGELLASWGSKGTQEGQFKAGYGQGPWAIAVDAEGNNYVTDPENNRVQKFDADGKFLFSLTGSEDQSFVRASAVALDSQGNVYVGDRSGTLFKFDSDGKFLGLWWVMERWVPEMGTFTFDPSGSILYAGAYLSKQQLPQP